MSPLGLASVRSGWGLGVAWALLGVFAVAPGARAQAAATLLVFAPSAPPSASDWVDRVTRALGPVDLDATRLAVRRARPDGIARARLAALSRIEGQLAEARELAAGLAEGDALALLARAADAAEQLADMPGAAAWNAEVQLWLAVIAAQAGASGLSHSAFRRAAALDPTRHLLEAEAPPEIVALSERVQREVALGPRGEMDVRASVGGARVILDDVPQGTAPLRVRAPVGRHVLRVEAAGYATYAAFIDVLEGERPPLEIALAEAPLLAAARDVDRAARGRDYAALPAALAALAAAGAQLDRVLVLESAGAGRRALLVRCDAQGCRRAARALDARLPAAWPDGPLRAAELARDRAWLDRDAEPARTAAVAWWQHWYVWGPLAAVAAGATAFALTYDPQPERRLRVMVDAGDVAP
jgi:hypothetical protein